MKKPVLSVLWVCCLSIFAVLSCQKSYNNTRGPQKSLNQLFAGLRTTPQSLSVQAGRDTIVYGTKGTMFHFYTNSFKDATGNIITSGTIALQLVEMYKVGDMIANRATTMANVPITSRGQVYVNATLNGAKVYANKYGIGFGQDNMSAQKMVLFAGNTNNTDSSVTWTVTNDTTTTGTTAMCMVTDSASNQHFTTGGGTYLPPPKPWYYVFDSCSAFMFVNCDYWFTNGEMGDMKVVMTDTSFNGSNTQVFIAFPAKKVNLMIPAVQGSPYQFSISSIYYHGMPVGENYEVIAITNKNGSFYYAEQSGVVTDGLIINPAMSLSTESAILTGLAGL